MNITVEIRSVYGREMIYPADNTARVFSFLTGKRTFSRTDIAKIKELGYTINIKQEAATL